MGRKSFFVLLPRYRASTGLSTGKSVMRSAAQGIGTANNRQDFHHAVVPVVESASKKELNQLRPCHRADPIDHAPSSGGVYVPERGAFARIAATFSSTSRFIPFQNAPRDSGASIVVQLPSRISARPASTAAISSSSVSSNSAAQRRTAFSTISASLPARDGRE